jgi:hypothetical protein
MCHCHDCIITILTLLQYLTEVIDRFKEWPPAIQKALIALLSAEGVPVAYFNNEVTSMPIASPAPSPSAETASSKVSHLLHKSASKSATNRISDEEDMRISQLQLHMDIKITLINTGDHPMYKIHLFSGDNIYNVEQTLRFAAYRDFQLQKLELCAVKMKSPFPETKTISALGLKLSDEELGNRSIKLSKVHTYFQT